MAARFTAGGQAAPPWKTTWNRRCGACPAVTRSVSRSGLSMTLSAAYRSASSTNPLVDQVRWTTTALPAWRAYRAGPSVPRW